MSNKRFYYAACGLFLALVGAFISGSPSPPVVNSEPLFDATSALAVTTPSPGPSCLSITGSTPRCYWPNTLNYYFAFFNSCNSDLTGSGTVGLELGTSTGAWTVYDQVNVNLYFPPGTSYTSGNFVENNIPSEYRYYRFSMTLNTSNGQALDGWTASATLCNTAGTPSPTPTGITRSCSMSPAGAQSTCSQSGTYTYNFGIYSSCDTSMYGTVVVQMQVSPGQGGPWTTYDTQTLNGSYNPGVNSVQGSFTEPYIPSQYSWYRMTMSASYPGPFGNRYVTSETEPAPICNPTLTATVTPTTTTPTATPTRAATPTTCPQNYTYATATATIVPGTVDTGNHCDDCFTEVTLPFSYRLYDQTFSSVFVESNGRASFPGLTAVFPVECLPQPGITYNIFPYWGNDLLTDCTGCGIYTSVSGTAPNRIFNIEWRTGYFAGGGSANFEVRLYEAQTRFDVIYGVVTAGNTGSLAGVQKDNTYWTQYFCNGQGGDANNGRLVVYTLPPCGTFTPTPSVSPTATGTLIATATPCPIQFSDVDQNNTFYASIRCLACRGIVSGYSDGTFRPNNPVTRGQLAKMVSNAGGFNEPVSGPTFQDVPPSHTFYEFVERLTSRGYMTGYVCGGPGEPCINNRPYFRPQSNATRGQTSKIVSNAAGIQTPIPPDRQTFEDVPSTHTFWLWIERLATRNVMTGYECGGPGEPCLPPGNRPYFRPGNDVTRGQSAKIVANTFFPNCSTP